MKKYLKILVALILLISLSLVSNTTIFAQDVIYTDNLIPKMTSNTAPSGAASASSVYVSPSTGGTLPAYEAFDRSTAKTYASWATTIGTTAGWLEYDFPTEKCITKYNIQPREWTEYISQSPKNWTFEAYDENTNTWIVLDTQTNVTDWAVGSKKEFTFTNNIFYKKYRINVTSIVDSTSLTNTSTRLLVIGELEMMEIVATPANLKATASVAKVDLIWDTISNASSYNIKRSTTSGGPYETINTVTNTSTESSNAYIDSSVTNGTTYYYIITAIVEGKEGNPSTEVSATPQEPTPPTNTVGDATVRITMITGEIKEYDLTSAVVQNFITWYDNRSEGIGKAYYTITKATTAGFSSRKEYLAFDKISSFEIMEYN